jgi:MFS family permease
VAVTQKQAATEQATTYRGLFATPSFGVLLSAHMVSMLGTMTSAVALTVLVFDRTGSPLLSSLTFTVNFLPYLAGGALLSGLVDRWPARRTMVGCDVLSAILFLVMALPGMPIAALLVLDFAAGAVTPVFGGARTALLPQLVGTGQRYVLARSMFRMVTQSSQVIGFACAGLLLATVGARPALALDAASFAVSAVIVRAWLPAGQAAGAATTSLVRDSLGAGRAVLADGRIRRLMLLEWLVPTCALAPEALAAAYVAAIHAPRSAVGLYLAAIPVAMVLADLVGGRFLGAIGQRRLILPGGLLTTAPLIGFVAMPGLGAAIALLALVGLGYSYGLALNRLLLEALPTTMQGRGLAVNQAGLMVLQGLGFALWGALGQAIGLRQTIVLAGCCGLLVVALLAPRVLRESRFATPDSPSSEANIW